MRNDIGLICEITFAELTFAKAIGFHSALMTNALFGSAMLFWFRKCDSAFAKQHSSFINSNDRLSFELIEPFLRGNEKR